MKIRFSSNEIREFTVGELVLQNDGSDLEVSPALGEELLKAVHPIGTESVPVFELSGDSDGGVTQTDELTAPAADQAPTEDTFESLMALTRAALNEKALALGIEGAETLSNKEAVADAILSTSKETE
jgi:hypothetical protein